MNISSECRLKRSLHAAAIHAIGQLANGVDGQSNLLVRFFADGGHVGHIHG